MGFLSFLIDLMTSSCQAAQRWIVDWTLGAPWPDTYGRRKARPCEELDAAKTKFLDDEWTTYDYIDFGAIVLSLTLLVLASLILMCNTFPPRLLAWTSSRRNTSSLDSKYAMRLKYRTPSDDQVWKQCDSCHRLVRIQRKKAGKN